MDSQKWNGIALLMHDLWNPQWSIAEEATINFRITTDVFKISQCTREDHQPQSKFSYATISKFQLIQPIDSFVRATQQPSQLNLNLALIRQSAI